MLKVQEHVVMLGKYYEANGGGVPKGIVHCENRGRGKEGG